MAAHAHRIDRRASERFETKSRLTVIHLGRRATYPLRNLSVGGASIIGEIGVPVGSRVEVALDMPLYPTVRLRARILRREDHGGAVHYAAQFVHEDDLTQDHIQSGLLSELEQRRAVRDSDA